MANKSHQQKKHVDGVAKDATHSDGISQKCKMTTSSMMSPSRMKTRSMTNNMNSKEQNISMKKEPRIRSKTSKDLTEYVPPENIDKLRLKLRIRSYSIPDSVLVDDETIITKCRKREVNKRNQSSTALNSSVEATSQAIKRKRSASAEPSQSFLRCMKTTSKEVCCVKEPLSKKRCLKRCASVGPEINQNIPASEGNSDVAAPASSFTTAKKRCLKRCAPVGPEISIKPTSSQIRKKGDRKRRDHTSVSKEETTPIKIKKVFENMPVSEGKSFVAAPTSPFTTAVSLNHTRGSPFSPLPTVQKPINFNPINNSLILGNPFLQMSPHVNQSVYPTLNQFAGYPQNTYLMQNPGNISSLNSLPSPQSFLTYPVYQTSPMLQPSNFQYNNSLNATSPKSNTALNSSRMNLHNPVFRNRRMPIILNSSTSETHTYSDTQTLIPKSSKGLSFKSLKDIVNGARKVCTFKMCDSVLRFYTENESLSKVTVKEFYLGSDIADALRPKIVETVPDFDIERVEYVFGDDFHESPIRDVVKDYVSFHLAAIYRKPASKGHFVEKAFKYFPFRDCTYLCESFPKDDGEYCFKDIIFFLGCAALLAIFDECQKENILV